jgi:hypothetical protein
MKYTYQISTAIMLSSLFVNTHASDFNVILGKQTNYVIGVGSTLPDKDEGVDTTVTNGRTLESITGNIMAEKISLPAENSDVITIQTIVNEVDDIPIIGTWSSNISLNYTEESKDGVQFAIPENYEGNILLTLTLDDGNYIKSMKEIIIPTEYWVNSAPIISDWQVDNVVQDWSPDLSTQYENELVLQTRLVDRSRTIQDQKERPSTGDVRNEGEPQVETELSATETRNDFYGLKEYWTEIDPIIIKDWTVTEVFQDWTPSAETVYENTTVDQVREVKKERIIQRQEERPKTGDIRNLGGQVTDTTLTSEYQTIPGLLAYWENTGESTCTEWVIDRHEAWLPDASNYDRDEVIDQTRLVYESRECSGEQYRPATDEYRFAEAEVEYRSTEESRIVYGTKINLNDWSTKDSNGDWSVSQDGSYVYQAINGNPTIFESKADTYGNAKISGKIRVRSAAGDDDFIGMVFGMKNSKDFYMWSWKKGNQSINGGVSYEGHYLAHVTGGVGAINWFMEKDKTGYDALDSKISTSAGWNHNTYYDFEIIYSSNKIEIFVEGSKVLSASGSNFPDGKIGFFNLSQGMVEYYKVTEEAL